MTLPEKLKHKLLTPEKLKCKLLMPSRTWTETDGQTGMIRGSNLQPPDHQLDRHPTEPPRLARLGQNCNL